MKHCKPDGRTPCLRWMWSYIPSGIRSTEKEGVCDVCGGELIATTRQAGDGSAHLGVYHENSAPLIDYYTKAGILKTVDGTKDMEDVFAEIVEFWENNLCQLR